MARQVLRIGRLKGGGGNSVTYKVTNYLYGIRLFRRQYKEFMAII